VCPAAPPGGQRAGCMEKESAIRSLAAGANTPYHAGLLERRDVGLRRVRGGSGSWPLAPRTAFRASSMSG
jgi:hypothetical protein